MKKSRRTPQEAFVASYADAALAMRQGSGSWAQWKHRAKQETDAVEQEVEPIDFETYTRDKDEWYADPNNPNGLYSKKPKRKVPVDPSWDIVPEPKASSIAEFLSEDDGL